MEKLLSEIEKSLNRPDKLEPSISEKGIYWHIDHALRVITGILKVLEESDPKEYHYHLNWKRSYIFFRGSLPRGKGRAPKAVTTDAKILESDLRALLLKAKMALDKSDKISSKSFFKHPYFGMLNKKQSKRFIEIHTLHHLKIVRDIRAAATKKKPA